MWGVYFYGSIKIGLGLSEAETTAITKAATKSYSNGTTSVNAQNLVQKDRGLAALWNKQTIQATSSPVKLELGAGIIMRGDNKGRWQLGFLYNGNLLMLPSFCKGDDHTLCRDNEACW